MRWEGFDIARCNIARLMKDIGIEGVVRSKKPKTTIPDMALPCPFDKVSRRLREPAPNMLWVSDFTYVTTWQGFVYAAFVLDALEQAIHQRSPAQDQLVHHSDSG